MSPELQQILPVGTPKHQTLYKPLSLRRFVSLISILVETFGMFFGPYLFTHLYVKLAKVRRLYC